MILRYLEILYNEDFVFEGLQMVDVPEKTSLMKLLFWFWQY